MILKKKYPDKNNLVEKGFILVHNAKLQSIRTGKEQRWELEGAGHITSIIRSRTVDESVLVLISLPPLSYSAESF